MYKAQHQPQGKHNFHAKYYSTCALTLIVCLPHMDVHTHAQCLLLTDTRTLVQLLTISTASTTRAISKSNVSFATILASCFGCVCVSVAVLLVRCLHDCVLACVRMCIYVFVCAVCC